MIDGDQADHQSNQRHHRGEPAPAAKGLVTEAQAGRAAMALDAAGRLEDGGLALADGTHTGGTQPLGDIVGQIGAAHGQARGHLETEAVLQDFDSVVERMGHSLIPFAVRALLRA